MAYKISFTIDGSLLICVAHGERNYSDSMQMWKAIITEIKKHAIESILLDLHMKGRFLPNESLGLTQKLVELMKPLNTTIAIVDHQPESFHDNYVAGVIAHQHNIKIKIFSDFKAAQNWLAKIR